MCIDVKLPSASTLAWSNRSASGLQPYQRVSNRTSTRSLLQWSVLVEDVQSMLSSVVFQCQGPACCQLNFVEQSCKALSLSRLQAAQFLCSCGKTPYFFLKDDSDRRTSILLNEIISYRNIPLAQQPSRRRTGRRRIDRWWEAFDKLCTFGGT